jgi:hypothetical protein
MARAKGRSMADSKETTLDDLTEHLDTIDLNNTTMQSGSDWLTSDTITISSPSYSYDTSYSMAPPSISITGVGQSTGHKSFRTTNTGGYTIGQGNNQPSNNIHIKGADADLVINDKSLKSWMEKVEERLNILTPNPALEKEWDQLRRLGERYRKLEKKCQEKSSMLNKLKNMPRPEL